MKLNIFFLIITIVLGSCTNETIPKPQGFLKLEYPEPVYAEIESDCPYVFEKNKLGDVRFQSDCSARVEYPALDASLFLTYREVQNNIETLLRDAQKLTYEHVRKADNIVEDTYINPSQQAYGMFYDVLGNAASQTQFYITDSTTHFLTGSIYFNAKPNYDSVYPAAVYLKKDIRHLMETIAWKAE